MKKIKIFLMLLCMFLTIGVHAEDKKVIRINTADTDLLLQIGDNGRLYQSYLGEKLIHDTDLQLMEWNVHAATDGSVSKRGWEVYSCNGNEEYYEPALSVIHADGNRTTYLYYQKHSQHTENGIQTTEIELKDDTYLVTVKLFYVAYEKENVIKTWSEISHREKKPVKLLQFFSTMLYFSDSEYYCTEFSSDWAAEGRMSNQQLQFGKKVVDTKLGSRAAMHAHPFFEVGIGAPVQENQGQVLMGTIGWTGNFRYVLEVDNVGNLRVLPGINPYSSDYILRPNETFRTADFIFTLSQQGTGKGSRQFHDWARQHQVWNGKGNRMTLLNNWENTGFNFNQEILSGLMKETKKLGADLFLLDDGWFANGENARKNDRAGLGDWEVNKEKLPGGIPALTKAAKDAGVKFGIWIEPEMINPKSLLYKKHPEWVIQQPNRKTYYYRHQLVLDLSNPKVQDHVYGVVADIMNENPEVAFFKWDCNSPITNIYSPYQEENQGQLYIDHVRGVYNVLKRVRENFPEVPIMMCSGGGARCDFEALKYFTEFWASDNTDPIERIFIQWGFSQFFPAKTMCAHVTSWNKTTSIKFRTDVASMGKLGFDIGLKELNADELTFCQQAIQNWNKLKPVILDGDQYRLISPYETNHMAVNYVNKEKSVAVLFAYDIHPRFGEKLPMVRLRGLDAETKYKVEEINLMPGEKSGQKWNGKTLSGDFLMKVGLSVFSRNQTQSCVVKLTAQ